MGPHFVLVTLGRCEVSCTDKRTGRAKRVQMLARGDSWGDACFSSVGSKASLFAAKRSGESLIARGKVAVFTLQKRTRRSVGPSRSGQKGAGALERSQRGGLFW
eukprot:229905_1